MSRIFAITKILLFVLLAGMTSTVFAQSDDFTTWTKFKVNYKIDPRFSLLSNLEFRTKDDVSRMDRLGLAIGGEYRAYSFLKLEAGYETHSGIWEIRNGNSDTVITLEQLQVFKISG